MLVLDDVGFFFSPPAHIRLAEPRATCPARLAAREPNPHIRPNEDAGTAFSFKIFLGGGGGEGVGVVVEVGGLRSTVVAVVAVVTGSR